MNVAILGYAVDGVSSAKYWHNLGNEITVCDKDPNVQVPNWATAKLGEKYLNGLEAFDLIVRSPGVHPSEITKASPGAPAILKKVTSCVNEFFAQCPAPIIAVTGTKGKGTTSTLIYEFLKATDKSAFLGGNIGTVPLDFLPEVTPDSWVVLELSNFQLIDFVGHPKIAVCLMLTPEHQDWHNDINDYYQTKERLFAGQTAEDVVVYKSNNETSTKVASVSLGKKIPYVVPTENDKDFTRDGVYVDGDKIYMQNALVCQTGDVALLGRFNLENVCAAIGAVWDIIGGNVELITKVVKEFTGLEHRLEFVREVGKVKYYDDSFATTPEATIGAIQAFKEPKVVILGGHDKGIPFFDLASEVASNDIRQVVVIGDTAGKISELLTERGFNKITLGGNTMAEIVSTAKNVAQPGDVVLLSTACASFGLFKNYKERGDQFKAVVNSL
jgi:UDP-N-acetylmuramoylalanine--D-glutamate ligase